MKTDPNYQEAVNAIDRIMDTIIKEEESSKNPSRQPLRSSSSSDQPSSRKQSKETALLPLPYLTFCQFMD